jgi:AraC family transcriptional regulator
VEGLPTSTLRYFKRKLTFVPANRDYREWHEPRAKTRLIFFYFDPLMVQNFGMTSGEVEFRARMFFENTTLWEAASKLKRAAESTAAEDKRYVEVLADLLLCELVRFNRGTHNVARPMCGGLASRHQRIVADYIEGHLADRVPLRTLAQLVGLTPSHFCRAFKHSFGMPPHRYHVTRRIECAKRLLAKRDSSVTDIGLIMGFSEASSFTTAFRRITGLTPSAYSRGLA